jgi:hypothetical protein
MQKMLLAAAAVMEVDVVDPRTSVAPAVPLDNIVNS